MAKRLFVGNLPWSVTDQALSDHFSSAGNVTSASVVIDRQTGRSRGFGFVEFENDEEAQKAIETFDGQELEGRALTVNEARPSNRD